MRIVLFNWRDRAHPRAGGAEVYTDDLLSELAHQGHDCTLFASAAPGLAAEERNDRYRIIRAGNELTCRFHGVAWLARHRDEIDLAIDEVNTLPFLSRLVLPSRTVLLMHQLAREVWWKEAPLPLSAIGYALEPAVLQIYRGAPVITISESSLRSIRGLGLARDGRIIECPLRQPSMATSDYQSSFVLGYVGRVTPSKRVDDIIRAFAIIHGKYDAARLSIVGKGPDGYVKSLHVLAAELGVEERIDFHGHVSSAERDRLMSTFACLLMASVREGWGLVVSEAAAYGVPTVAYDVAGLRDSIDDGNSGLIVRNGDWRAMAAATLRILDDPVLRERLGTGARTYLSNYTASAFSQKVSDAFAAFALRIVAT